MAEAVFETRGEQVFATELARGPWDPGSQHGGAPAALLMRAFERLETAPGLQISRVTYEFLRPVPLGELSVSAEVVRPGRRVSLAEGAIRTPDGAEVARARALLVQAAVLRVAPAAPAPPPPGPQGAGESDLIAPFRPMFAPDAIEIRFVEGSFHGVGPSTAWFHLRVPLIAGEQASPLQRLAACGDFGNGISAPVSWEDHLFINPDLTLYVERPPQGQWLALQARTIVSQGGIGVSESVLFDTGGRVGRATQALLMAPR
jgi:hypothetical protein